MKKLKEFQGHRPFPTKYFVVMKQYDNTLRCLGREGSYSAGACTHYGWQIRGWAEKFATKRGGQVYSVQGQTYNGLLTEADHEDLARDAEEMVNPRGYRARFL